MLPHYVWLQFPSQSPITLSVGFWDGDQMRIFARGLMVALIVALIAGYLFDDIPTVLGNTIVYAAFICGAVSQMLKQFKGEG